MVKLTLCMRRLPHLTRAEFHRYWRDEHPKAAPAGAVENHGVRRYVQDFALPAGLNGQSGVARRTSTVWPRSGSTEPTTT